MAPPCLGEDRDLMWCQVALLKLPETLVRGSGVLPILMHQGGLTRRALLLLQTSLSATNLGWIRGCVHRASTILISQCSREQGSEPTNGWASSFGPNFSTSSI